MDLFTDGVLRNLLSTSLETAGPAGGEPGRAGRTSSRQRRDPSEGGRSIQQFVRWVYETDGIADGLVVMHRDDVCRLAECVALAPELVVLFDRHEGHIKAYWHLANGAFLCESEVGEA